MPDLSVRDTGSAVLTTEEFLQGFSKPAFFLLKDANRSAGGSGNNADSYFLNTYAEIEEELKLRNDNGPKNQRGVFFTPNGEYFGKERRDRISGSVYQYLVLDFDGMGDENIRLMFIDNVNRFNEYLSLCPRYVVRTGKGYHLYYKFKEPVSRDGMGTVKYKNLQTRVLNHIDSKLGDPSCSDISRLFRLPGFRYWKDNLGETIINVCYHNPNAPEIDFLPLFEALALEEETVSVERERNKLHLQGSTLVEQVNQIPITQVLTALGYKFRGPIIWEGDKETDGWRINVRDNYVNNFTLSRADRPSGQPYAFILRHFEQNQSEMRKFITDQFPEVQYPEDPTGFNIDSPTINIQDSVSGGTIAINTRDKRIDFIDRKGIVKQYANFIIEPIGMLVDDDKQATGHSLVRLRGSHDTPVVPLPVKSGGISFSDDCKRLGPFSWECFNIGHLALIVKNVFAEVSDKMIYTNDRIGFNARDVFITGETVATPEGVAAKNVYGLVGDERIDGLPRVFDTDLVLELPTPDDARHRIASAFDILRSIYEPSIIVPLALTALLGLVAPYLRRHRIPVPYCSLFGITQTGKTTISELVKEDLLSDKSERLSAATTTLLPLQEALRHGKAVFVGEFRGNNERVSDRIYGLLRDCFDGAVAKRGTQNLSVISWPMIGTIIIDGEHIIEDPATFSRGIYLHCREGHKRMKPRRKAVPSILLPFLSVIFEGMKAGGTDTYFSMYHQLRDSLAQDLDEKYKAKGLMSTGENSRVLESYASLFALGHYIGLDLRALITECDPSITEQLQHLSDSGARTKMIEDLARIIDRASSGDVKFIDFPSNEVVQIKLNPLMAWFDIDKKMSTHRLDSLTRALNGEPGFVLSKGVLTIHVEQIQQNQTLKDAILKYCVETGTAFEMKFAEMVTKNFFTPKQ